MKVNIRHSPLEGKVALSLVLGTIILVVVLLTFFLQNFTKTLLRQRLDERLVGLASTAVLNFDAQEISKINNLGKEVVGSEVYKKNVLKLQQIRNVNKDIRYAYIIAKTEDPKIVKYVVDADAMSIVPVVDFNADGVVDDEDVSKPGDEYDASDVPAMQGPAFEHPIVDAELSNDSWGSFLSVYAPIYGKSGQTIAALTLDVNVGDFNRLVNSTLIPFILFVCALILVIFFLTIYIVRIWNSRLHFLQDLDRQKDELLGMVSHQLAKPITAIKWNLESMLDGDTGPLSADQKESAVTMRTMAANLSDLVSMILDVSRVQMGKIKLDPQPMDLHHLFKEIFDIVAPTIAEKKIQFDVSMEPTVLPTALLDRRYTRMTFENLITNAVKYTPESGTVKLRLRIANGKLSFRISDTGYGIPKAEQGKIFGKMYRASNVRNTQEGNGFGLYVAKGAVEGQNGKIWFESTEGKGTTFYVDLPVKVVT